MTMYSVHMGLVFPCSVGLPVTNQLADPGGGGRSQDWSEEGGGAKSCKYMPKRNAGGMLPGFFLSNFSCYHVIAIARAGGWSGQPKKTPEYVTGGYMGSGPPF